MQCHACKGESFERQAVTLTTRVGNHRVVDRSLRLPVCLDCGEFVVPAEAHEKVELRAALVAFTDAPRVTGAMLRFARKALDMTQAELAERLSVAPESISRWEREERPMEPWVPLAVLGLLRERLMPPPSGVELKRAG